MAASSSTRSVGSCSGHLRCRRSCPRMTTYGPSSRWSCGWARPTATSSRATTCSGRWPRTGVRGTTIGSYERPRAPRLDADPRLLAGRRADGRLVLARRRAFHRPVLRPDHRPLPTFTVPDAVPAPNADRCPGRRRWPARPSVPPAGFVFHMSRCGSTLVSQMLAAHREHIVISEAGPIDTVLQSHRRRPGIGDEQRIESLRGLLAAYGQPGCGSAQRLFVKFDSWSVLDLPLVARAFPDVPWVFVYRDPVEVLASTRTRPRQPDGAGMLEPGLLGLDRPAVGVLSLDEYRGPCPGRGLRGSRATSHARAMPARELCRSALGCRH